MATTCPVNRGAAEPICLCHFPISFFAVVMGLCGLAIAWQQMGALLALPPALGIGLALLATAVFILAAAAYGAKLALFPGSVREEWRNPVRISFFPTLSISLLLLSYVWISIPALSLWIWVSGALLQILLTLAVLNNWINQAHYQPNHANPSWFLPVVGTIIAPISGVHHGFVEISWFYFSVGILFWLVILNIVIYRLFFHEPLPLRLTPTLFILLAPPSVGFISYTMLVGGLDVFARILYDVALFMAAILIVNAIRFCRCGFFLSAWAYSFPLAAFTIATMRMSRLADSAFFRIAAFVLIALLSVLLLWLFVRTLKSVLSGQIFRPE